MDHFLKISIMNFQLDLDLDCSLAMSLIFICLSWRKILILFALWQNVLSFWKKTLSLPNQFSVDGMQKLSRISMYTCILIVEVMIAIFPGPLNDIQPHILNDLGSLHVFFMFHLNYSRQKSHHHCLGQQTPLSHLHLSSGLFILCLLFLEHCSVKPLHHLLSFFLTICLVHVYFHPLIISISLTLVCSFSSVDFFS